MSWISLVCLLVFTSSALGRSAYGNGYSAAPVIAQAPRLLPVVPVQIPTYGQQQPILPQRIIPIMQQDTSFMQPKLPTGYSSSLASPMTLVRTLPVQGYGVPSMIPQLDQPLAPTPTQADILCQGQAPETVIPLEDGRKFVVCLDAGKGTEQECPKGLFYNTAVRRCERKNGPVDACATQPCLNGGQCFPTDSSYQCQCAPGFDGQTCELDARVCQTQQPCGQSPDARCQSFRLGAALQYICIFQDGHAYGLNPQQVIPSPCQNIDGPQALAVTNAGFIMCDADRMFVESCPGGTLWDDIEKACSWPDKQTIVSIEEQSRMISKSTYGNQYSVPPRLDFPKQTVSYGNQYSVPPQLDLPKPTVSYGNQYSAPPQLDLPKPTVSYGAKLHIPPRIEPPRIIQSVSSDMIIPKVDLPKSVYGTPLSIPPSFDQSKIIQSHKVELDIPRQVDVPKSVYGTPLNIPPSFDQSKIIQSHQVELDIPRQVDVPKSVYGTPLNIPPSFDQSRIIQSQPVEFKMPKTVDLPKFSASFIAPPPPPPQRDEVVPVKSSYGY